MPAMCAGGHGVPRPCAPGKIYSGGNCRQLSGGEKQRIPIARAMLKDTPCIIMDEPSNHVHRSTVEWIRRIYQKTSKTVLYVSHDLSLLDYADCCIHLEGRQM